jgi:lipoprotein-anchoring transpeptidase ErfK/SrfK
MKRLLPTLALLLLALPAGASAQAPPTTQTLVLAAQNVGSNSAVTAGRTWQVHGQLSPIVLGQQVVVTFMRRSVLLGEQTVDVDSTTGSFTVDFKTNKGGQVTVKAVTVLTPADPVVQSNEVKVTVLGKVNGKRKGGSVRELQRLLRRKGYVVGKTGVYDERTARAVMAFRKVTGMHRSFNVDSSVLRALAHGRGRYRVRFPKHGRHVEADISRQVMVFAKGGKVERIYHISSGSPATPTVRGAYRVYRKSSGTNAKGMVDSSYFIRGYAIHGYASVPSFNASHGCLRVPVPDAASIFSWVRLGTRVDTYL